MAEVFRSDGCVIRVFSDDHEPAHVHVSSAEQEIKIDISGVVAAVLESGKNGDRALIRSSQNRLYTLLIADWLKLKLLGSLFIMDIKIVGVRYLADTHEIEVRFSSGARLSVLVDSLEMLTWTGKAFVPAPRPSAEQLANARVWAGGYAVDFPDINQNFDVDELMALLPVASSLTDQAAIAAA